MPDSLLPTSTGDLTPAGHLPGVNPAQVPGTLLEQPQPQGAALHSGSSPADVSAVIASYENRLRAIMSEKDKAIHERNQTISQLAEIQQSYSALQEQTSTSLTATANAAQTAIGEGQRLGVRVQHLEGELQKAQLLLKYPNLAAYEKYIPTKGTLEEQQKAIDDLNAIREQDMQKIAQGLPPVVANPLAAGQQQQQAGFNPNAYFNLLGQRTNLSPQIMGQIPPVAGGTIPVPGSTPAMMSPTGTGGTTAAIEHMLREARATGDPAVFQKAVAQAATLAEADVRAQMGRG